MMTLPPNSYPAEIGVWLSVTASNPWTTVLDFFQGGTIRAGRVPLCVPLLRSLGRARRRSHPFAPSVIRGQLNQQTQPV